MTSQPADHIWEAVLGRLQLQVTRPSYETWFKGTVGVACDEKEFVVGTSSTFVAEMLEQRMYSLISQATERVTGSRVEIRFQVVPQSGRGVAPLSLPNDPASTNGGSRQNDGHHLNRTEGHRSNGIRTQAPLFRKPSLNPKYTFDSFIVGSPNELSYAAATAVAERPGSIYNPLLIYSKVGLGKTHLLHAIGHKVLSTGNSLIYATTEEFTNQYIKSIREGRTEEFRDRYRGVEVLLLDDIQFLIGKEQTQEGFFHTFNALHMANKQIVITCDRPVGSLTPLEDRVCSRLAGGLVVDIQPPDLETRLAILENKSAALGCKMNAEVVQYLAAQPFANIRDLQGVLNRLVAHSKLTSAAITIDLAKQCISFRPDRDRTPVSDQRVVDTVASYFLIPATELMGRKRDKKTALARQVTMYLLRREANLGPSAIGRFLGGKNHTTILHGCNRITRQINVDPQLRQDVNNIRAVLATR